METFRYQLTLVVLENGRYASDVVVIATETEFMAARSNNVFGGFSANHKWLNCKMENPPALLHPTSLPSPPAN